MLLPTLRPALSFTNTLRTTSNVKLQCGFCSTSNTPTFIYSQKENEGAAEKVLQFDNATEVFRHKSTRELLRHSFVLNVCAFEPLVKHSYKLMKTVERLIGASLLGRAISPFYRQFVAGDSEEEMRKRADSLSSFGINLMTAPMLETDLGDSSTAKGLFEKNFLKTLNLIEITWRCRPREGALRPICQTKITAHLNADILLNLAQAYEAASPEERFQAVRELSTVLIDLKQRDCKSDGVEAELKCLKLSGMRVTQNDLREFRKCLPKLVEIGKLCDEKGVILAVDAEYSYVNAAIGFITVALMAAFNEVEPVVWNTYQAYLKNAKFWLQHDYALVRSLGAVFGTKIVRGAYMEKERGYAELRKTPDPINDTYTQTNIMYDGLIDHLIHEVATHPTQCQFMVATHNEASILNATNQMAMKNIPHSTSSILFAQIYGMAENISIPLAEKGYSVYKSVAYGSVTEVLPYLSRRAAENRAVFLGARRERELLSEEIRNRMKSII